MFVSIMKLVVLATAAGLLSACASGGTGSSSFLNPAALSNSKAQLPFSAAYSLTGENTPREIQSYLIKYQADLIGAGSIAKDQEEAVSAVSFLGALAATFGAVYQKTALILAGAGVGGAGYAVNQQFGLAAKSLAYRNAAHNLSCIKNASFGVTDSVVELVKTYGASEADRTLAINATIVIVGAADEVYIRLQEALAAARPPVASENDWDAYFKRLAGKDNPKLTNVDTVQAKASLEKKGVLNLTNITDAKQKASASTANDILIAQTKANTEEAIVTLRRFDAEMLKCKNSRL